MTYQISEELVNEIIKTLSRYPYREVAVVINEIGKVVNAQNGKKIVDKCEETQ